MTAKHCDCCQAQVSEDTYICPNCDSVFAILPAAGTFDASNAGSIAKPEVTNSVPKYTGEFADLFYRIDAMNQTAESGLEDQKLTPIRFRIMGLAFLLFILGMAGTAAAIAVSALSTGQPTYDVGFLGIGVCFGFLGFASLGTGVSLNFDRNGNVDWFDRREATTNYWVSTSVYLLLGTALILLA